MEDGAGAETHTSHSSVLVVGGGVSGTACAGVLASRGFDVRLLSGSLDSLGIPDYSPCFLFSGAGEKRLLRGSQGSASAGLGRLWFENMWVLPGASWGVVDRRRVSIQLKEWVEEIGVQLRQGFATSIARVPQGWLVGTAFGESFTADVAVLSVGLSLGGHHLIGEREFPGARIGEVPSEGLLRALEAQGAVFDTAEVRVGSRLWRLPGSMPPFLRRAQLRPVRQVGPVGMLRGVVEPPVTRPASDRAPHTGVEPDGPNSLDAWIAARPPAPASPAAASPSAPSPKATSPAAPSSRIAPDLQGFRVDECPKGVFPDGAATGEWYVTPGLEQEVLGAPHSRGGYVARGLVFGGGRAHDAQEPLATGQVLEGLWATGRVTGARHTSESLLSGIACADAVERAVRERGDRLPRS